MGKVLGESPREDFTIPDKVVLVPVDLDPSNECVHVVTMAFVRGTEPLACGKRPPPPPMIPPPAPGQPQAGAPPAAPAPAPSPAPPPALPREVIPLSDPPSGLSLPTAAAKPSHLQGP